jgi:hypothetical protein
MGIPAKTPRSRRPQLSKVQYPSANRYMDSLEKEIDALRKHIGSIKTLGLGVAAKRAKHKTAKIEEWKEKYFALQKAMSYKPPPKAEVTEIALSYDDTAMAIFNNFLVSAIDPAPIEDFGMMYRFAHLFVGDEKRYDLFMSLLMFYGYPLEYFTGKSAVKVMEGICSNKKTYRDLNTLVRGGYLGLNGGGSKGLYYLTSAGKSAVEKMVKEYFKVKINLEPYGEIFREAFCEASQSNGKENGELRRVVARNRKQVQRQLSGEATRRRRSRGDLDSEAAWVKYGHQEG